MSDHILLEISTWAEVGILIFMVWEKYGPAVGAGRLIAAPTWSRRGIGQFLWENRTLIVAILGLIFVGWLYLVRTPPAEVTHEAPSQNLTTEAGWMLPSEAVDKFLPQALVANWRRTKNTGDSVDDFLARERTTNQIGENLRQLLLNGKLIARGVPHEAGASNSEPVAIGRAQWQTLTLPGPEFGSASSSVGPAHSYDDLELREGTAASSVATASSPVSAPTYAARSPSDAKKEIDLLDRVSLFLHEKVAPLPAQGAGILFHWQNAMVPSNRDSYFRNLETWRESLVSTNEDMSQMLKNVPQYCDDDLCIIVDPSRKMDDLLIAIDNFRKFLSALNGVIDLNKFEHGDFTDVVAASDDQLGKALSAYSVWISNAENELLKRRKELSEMASRQ